MEENKLILYDVKLKVPRHHRCVFKKATISQPHTVPCTTAAAQTLSFNGTTTSHMILEELRNLNEVTFRVSQLRVKSFKGVAA